MVNRVVMAVALQSFRNKQDGETTLQALAQIFRNKLDKPAGVMERRQFMQRIPNIVVMVDELAGDGAGAPFVHEIANWLHKQFIEPAQQGEALGRVTLVLSDASLANEVVLERYLAAGEQRAPDKVLVSRSRGKHVFDLAHTTLKLGTGKAQPALHVMTNSFPASSLQLEYKVRSSIVEMGSCKDGSPETVRQALRRVLGEKVQQSAIEEILRALQAGATQVIYFAQDKKMLGEMHSELFKQQPHLQVAVLDSSVPAHEREELLKPAKRDTTNVFLMTSSGARGISFPKADWIIATMPRFNIETALMEIAQLIYRGRGHYLNAQQQWVSGDKVPRHLVLLADDGVVVELGESLDLRQWLRQAIDLLTMLVMLRATIFTRISGDADLKQPLALVPVGAVGVEETISLMAQSVRTFVSEAHAALADLGQQQRALLMSAQKGVRELFADSKLSGSIGSQSDPRSMVHSAAARALHDLAAGMLQPLLIFSRNGTSLAPRLYANGPLFVEDWGDFEKEELFTFAGYNNAANQHLLKQLGLIRNDQKIPRNIRSAAIDLSRILERREQEEAETRFSTTKALTSTYLWVALPAGYAQFMDERSPPCSAEDAEAWRNGLARGLGSSHAPFPPLPSYAAFPWAARVGVADPLQLATVFDDRYFMACNELNLLNTLLLANA